MRSALTAAVVLATGFATMSPVRAQSGAQPWHDCVTTEIQDRLLSQQPVRLSADNISLTGATLRLSGRASIRFDDTTVRAEEIIIEQASKEVTLTTVRNIFIGARSRCSPPPSARPRIEFR
jgi:hypothetical protein